MRTYKRPYDQCIPEYPYFLEVVPNRFKNKIYEQVRCCKTRDCKDCINRLYYTGDTAINMKTTDSHKAKIISTMDVKGVVKTTESRKELYDVDVASGANIELVQNEFNELIFNRYRTSFEYYTLWRRVKSEQGIIPNRFFIVYNSWTHHFTLYTLLYTNSGVDETNNDKLLSIFEDRKTSEIYTKQLYNPNDLIQLKQPMWIPLSRMFGRIVFEDKKNIIKVGIDRFDAHSLIRGGGHIMLCFLLKWIAKRFPNNNSIVVQLETKEVENHKAYQDMGFTVKTTSDASDINGDSNRVLTYSADIITKCSVMDNKIGLYYYYESIITTLPLHISESDFFDDMQKQQMLKTGLDKLTKFGYISA